MKHPSPLLLTTLALTTLLAACGSPPPSNEEAATPQSGSNIESASALGITDGSAGSAQTYQNIPQKMVPFEERDKGDHFILRMDQEPPHLNILLDTTGGSASEVAHGNIFEQLLDVHPETLEFIPYIAKSWEISEDHLTYIFHLRDDVHFSDNVPLTAHDVKFTYDITMNPKTEAFQSKSGLQDIESVTVIDDYTIQYKMKKPFFRHLLILGLSIIYPKHIYEGEEDFNHHSRNRTPVGSGPYIFDKWDTAQQIVLTRNENYWGDKQPIEKRIWKIIIDPQAGFQALERGDIDKNDIAPDDWNRKASTPEFEKKFNKYTPDSPVPGLFSRYNYIGWNMRKPQFEDQRVRKALCLLFDRELVIETVYGGLGTVVTGSTYHKAPEYNQDTQPFPFDPAEAARLLDEAGWRDSDGDGIRDKNGIKLEFELSFGSNPEYERLGTVYQEELKRIGIEMQLAPFEWATFLERVHGRNFDACMLAWLTPIMQDPYPLWHSSQAEEGINYPGLKNDEIDQTLDAIRLEFDREKRIKLYHKVQDLVHEEQPYLFLYARPGLLAIDKRIHGTIEHTGGFDPRDWWVPAHLQKYK